MKIQKLPYIIYRDYPDYGYLTDNRNYGYDTVCKSSRKVGELIISKVGSIFYSVLENCPQTLEEIVNRFAFLMDCAMLGAGVGFDTKGAQANIKIYQPNKDIGKVFVIKDSR